MLGFNPLSDSPISDIGLPVITGTIYAVDSNDTADITAQVAVSGDISTTDGNDFANIFGAGLVGGYILATDNNDLATLDGGVLVSAVIDTIDGTDTADFEGATGVSGVIDTTDGNDTADIEGTTTPPTPEPTIDMHDGFTKDEVKRIKKLQKKIAQAEAQIIQARLDKRLARKQLIKDLVDPTQVKESEVNSVSEVKIDKPSIDLKKLNANLINLEKRKQQLLKTIELRQELARAQTALAIHQAQMEAAERDDEEALLLLI